MTTSRPIGAVSILQAIREREGGRSGWMSESAGNASGLRIHWNAMDLMTPVCIRQLGRNTGTDISEICCTTFPGRNILSNTDLQMLIGRY